MAIYRQKIRSVYNGAGLRFFYDQYRWVNNLNRIRKPAIERTEVVAPDLKWDAALDRIKQAYVKIQRLETGSPPRKNGECFSCPYKQICRA
jgi:hypothetical protein